MTDEKTIEELHANRVEIADQMAPLAAQHQEICAEINRRNGEASMAALLRAAGIEEDSLPEMVTFRMQQLAARAAADAELERVRQEAEVAEQEAEARRETLDAVPAREGGIVLDTITLGVHPGK